MKNVLAVLEECGAYVDDAASFPEQFKPGLVKRHQREYNEARATLERLAVAADLFLTKVDDGVTSWQEAENLRAALTEFRGDA